MRFTPLLFAALTACAPRPVPPAAPPVESAPTRDEDQPEAPVSEEPAPEPFDLEAVEPVRLPSPGWAYRLADATGRRALTVPRLVQVEAARNQITDTEAWLGRHGFAFPGDPGAATREVPFAYRGAMLFRVMEQGGVTLAVYGDHVSDGRFLVGLDDEGARFAYDFAAYLRAPEVKPGDEDFVTQGVAWAALVGDWLYVQTNHMTYAASSGGMNGYLTALDAETGALRWRSRTRVANARTFAVVGDALVSGYGFTAEPDFLYVLDRFTGEVRAEERTATAPEYLLVRDDRLYVRAYDHDYVYHLR